MAQEIKKPTTFTEGALLLWTDEANAYDQAGGGDESTYSYQILDTDEAPSITYHTWGTKGQTYTATTLYVRWQTSITTGDDEVHIEYTKNGGGAWADLLAKGINRSAAWTNALIALDANQDLTQVQVRVNSDKVKGADGCDFRISDIWTDGTYSAGGVSVTPDTLAIVITTFIPTVTATANQLVTPDTLAHTITAYIPTVTASDNKVVTPDVLNHTLTTYIPTISVSDNQLVTPDALAHTITLYPPTVTATQNQLVTPDTLALSTTLFIPTVTVGGDVTVTPNTLALAITTLVPVVTVSDNQIVTPDTVALTTTTFIPNVTTTANQLVTPGVLSLTLTTFIPTVTATGGTYAVLKIWDGSSWRSVG